MAVEISRLLNKIEHVDDRLNEKNRKYLRKLWYVRNSRNISDYDNDKKIVSRSQFSRAFKNNFDKAKSVVNKLT